MAGKLLKNINVIIGLLFGILFKNVYGECNNIYGYIATDSCIETYYTSSDEKYSQIFECSDDGTSISLSVYNTSSTCSGTPRYTSPAPTSFTDFTCDADDCSPVYLITYNYDTNNKNDTNKDDCDKDEAQYYQKQGYIGGSCINASDYSLKIVDSCTSGGDLTYNYTNSQDCTGSYDTISDNYCDVYADDDDNDYRWSLVECGACNLNISTYKINLFIILFSLIKHILI